jgi:hypothetical protein
MLDEKSTLVKNDKILHELELNGKELLIEVIDIIPLLKCLTEIYIILSLLDLTDGNEVIIEGGLLELQLEI